MTAQTGEVLLHNGKQVWMQTLPLEVYWDANPPRPFMLAASSAEWRGYIGEWAISERKLYLTKFNATAWRTLGDWIGDDGITDLWRFARLWNDSVATALSSLAKLPATATPANRRAARIVEALGEQLLSQGQLKPGDSQQRLHEAAVEASWTCFRQEEYPISIETLFPAAQGAVFASWYSGLLRIDEGELLDYQHAGFASVYEFTRLIHVKDGCVLNEERQKNEPPPSED